MRSGGVRISFDGQLDLDEVDRAMLGVKKNAKTLLPVFRSLRADLRRDIKDHANRQQGPSGKWAPRAASTEAKYRQARGAARRARKKWRMPGRVMGKKPKTLRQWARQGKRRSFPKKILGRIPTQQKLDVGPLFIRATARAKWSSAHNEGANVGRKHRSKLPKRQWQYMSTRFTGLARLRIERQLVASWGRK